MLAGGKSVFLMCPVLITGVTKAPAALQGTVINAEKQTAAYISIVQHVANKIKCNYITLIRSDFSGNDGLLFIPADLR